MMSVTPDDTYRAASTGAVLFDRGDRVRLEIRGPDRVRFLHNLTTNDIKRLNEGHGCEAFVTSLQGKTLGYLTVLALPERLLIRADAGSLEHLSPHFVKYGAFDDVTIDDASGVTSELHLAGPLAEPVVARLGGVLPEGGELRAAETALRGVPVTIVRESPTGRPGLTLIAGRDDHSQLVDALREVGRADGLVVASDPASWEVLRIEAGTPRYGADITTDNLPQEVGRDRQAISFVKGCYLGQETVARIDALGHVNKVLRGLRIDGGWVPPHGASLHSDGRSVGSIASSVFSPGWGEPIALAYIRTSHAAAGQELGVDHEGRVARAVVAELPMLPPTVV
jgi:folate-binding protein YgfZ